jgi:hypothetical protein
MGTCYYLLSREYRVVFDLDKGFGDYNDAGLHPVLRTMRETKKLPERAVFDRAVRAQWCTEMSKAEYEDTRLWMHFDPDRWVWDAEGDCFVPLGMWTGGDPDIVRQEGDDGRPAGAATHESALREAKERRAYAQTVADKLWEFCTKYGPALEIDSDMNDLPWYEWGERVEGPWHLVGSRCEPFTPRRLDRT